MKGIVFVELLKMAEDLVGEAAVDAVLQSRAGLRYKLEGEIRSSEPRERRDDFLFESSLSPVPGLTGVLR